MYAFSILSYHRCIVGANVSLFFIHTKRVEGILDTPFFCSHVIAAGIFVMFILEFDRPGHIFTQSYNT
jgi:hypothetical protein